MTQLQHILGLEQVKVSKHLAYLRKNQMVECVRLGNRNMYSLPHHRGKELEGNLKCLQDCVQEESIFIADIKRLEAFLTGHREETHSCG